jgi:hypothetical protein
MSGRPNLSAAMLAQLDALQNRPGHLFECYFDDETVRTTDFYTSVTWGGNTYVAVGDLLGYDGVAETLEMRAAQARVSLSGVDQVWIARVLAKQYINRRLVIRKAILDAAWAVIADPGVVFDGEMKQPQIVEDPESGTCEVVITASHAASDTDNPGGRRTNDKMHRLLFPNDGFFKYAQQARNQLVWGMP